MANKQEMEELLSNSLKNKEKTALVTGANSGIGFETAAVLSEQGYGKIILATRTTEKGELARIQLIERTGKSVFDILAIDLSEPSSVQIASDELLKKQDKIDLLILNAGMSSGEKRLFNSDGVEMTFASHIVGHHILTMRLLSDGLLTPDAHIVIAGSEGARSDFPGMDVVEFDKFANNHFNGDLVKALEIIGRYQPPYEDKGMNIYVTTKTYTNWWAAVLSRKLPKGMVVNAVSPGSVPSTNYARHQGFFMRRIMLPFMKYPGRFMGMSWSARNAANRYIEAGEFDTDITGHFFGSPVGKFTGKMEIQNNDHFLNPDYQESGWKAIVKLSNGIDYPSNIGQ